MLKNSHIKNHKKLFLAKDTMILRIFEKSIKTSISKAEKSQIGQD
jgi:hypothetical protein